MRINTNIPAIQSYNALTITNNALAKSINKLSTGLRINSAADDAAGLAISEKMRAQYRGLDQAATNAQDGISMIQTAEGALNETHSILQRMRELAVQAANDTLTQEDRSYIQLEVDQLKEEIDRISTTTQFNKKQLLDGSAAAVWSADKLATRAIINGGLREIDQFGQKKSLEGNYKIEIKATPGQTQVQKSDIFRIKHPNVIMGLVADKDAGVESVRIDSLPAGTYNLTTKAPAKSTDSRASAAFFQDEGLATTVASSAVAGLFNFDVDDLLDGQSVTQNALFEVTNVNTAAGTITMNVSVKELQADGSTISRSTNGLIVSVGGTDQGIAKDVSELGWTNTKASSFSMQAGALDSLTVGDKFVYNMMRTAGTAPTVAVVVNGKLTESWGAKWINRDDTDPAKFEATYNLDHDKLAGKEVRFENFYLNEQNGTVYEGTIVVGFNENFNNDPDKGLATFEAAYVGQIAKGDVALRDIDKFWDANGKFMLADPKTITLTQGDGTKTSVTLYSTDTISDMKKKFNDAIANGLGQGTYTKNNTTQFVTFVEEGKEKENTSESVPGTMLIRSLIPGAAGEISLSGDEDVIKAFSLNVIQESRESQYELNITDAHSGNVVQNGIKVTGNKALGVINANVDLIFDAMANIDVEWNDTTKKFSLTQAAGTYSTVLHLSDNTTVFQIGANEGEDMGVNIGNMSAESLGVDRLIVSDRENAARSITMVDNAINKVSLQRARLGAYQNRLEHTINNLTTASTNLKSSESRIRDADMAKEMMEFTKLNILSQAGNSMLAQANQLPQNVLSLLR